jgi:cytochrome P450
VRPVVATWHPRWLLQASVRWGLQHGLVRVLLARAARHGDPQARLIMDRATRLDPYPVHEQVRERGALVHGRLTLVTASHAVSKEVLHSRDFAVGAGDTPPFPAARRLAAWAQDSRVLGPIDPPSLLAVEPPDRTRYRRLVAKVFTARAVEQLRPTVQSVADALLDDMARLPRGEPFDLVERYARLLPVRVIARILGVPDSEHARLLALDEQVSPSVDLGLGWREHLRVQRGLHDFNVWLEQHLARLRAAPGDDLLSQLVVVEDEGIRLDDVELRSTAGLVLAAGFETTVNLLGNGAKLLLDEPEQRELLRASRARWPDAVEEVLRHDAPVQVTGRRALRDTRVAGVDVAEGEHVTTLLAAANRDPEVFPDPQRFDVTRENAREHLSFSGGRHFCLGAALARVEGEVGLRALFDRFPDLVLAPGAQRRPTRVLRGWAHLPVRTGRPEG